MKFLPVIVVAIICLMLGVAMLAKRSDMPSGMLGKTFPSLPFNNAENIGAQDRVMMVNIFASWCVPCAAEHEQLLKLKNEHGLTIVGIAWKNQRADAMAWLTKRENPYTKLWIDNEGQTTIPLGLTGVPESFILKDGKIVYHTREPITEDKMNHDILPLLRELRS